MEARGFIQDMLDVKLLVLFVMSHVAYPVDLQKIYELSYQDDKLSYFDLSAAVPEMVGTGHLEQLDGGRYIITEKGRSTCEITKDAIAYPVMQRALEAVDRFNRETRRSEFVRATVEPENGSYRVDLRLNDEVGELLHIELMAPTQKQGVRLARAFRIKAETIYHAVMDELLAKPKEDA